MIFVLLILVSSCREAAVNEVKINDFAGLTAEFKSPSAEYTTAPFFVWNYKITKEEIDKFLLGFRIGQQPGIRLSTSGLVPEHLSDEWF